MPHAASRFIRSISGPASVLVVALACRPDRIDSTSTAPTVADSAEQIMYGVHNTVTSNGVLRGELFADTVFSLDDGTRFELRPVRVELRSAEGVPQATLRAREGTRWLTPDVVEARGDVVVESTAGDRRLETRQLRFDVARDELAGDSAFILVESGRASRGVGFVADARIANVRCLASCSGAVGTRAPAP